MGLLDKLKSSQTTTNDPKRRKSLFNFISPSQVTEQSLQVWRELPTQIRQDPSWASFRIEDERLHGPPQTINSQQSASDEPTSEQERTSDGEFINMKDLKMLGAKKGSDIDEHHSDEHRYHTEYGFLKQKGIKKRIIKMSLILLWLLCAISLVATKEKRLVNKQISLSKSEGYKYYTLPTQPSNQFKLTLIGPFLKTSPNININHGNYLTVQTEVVTLNNLRNETHVMPVLSEWILPVIDEHWYDNGTVISQNNTFKLSPSLSKLLSNDDAKLRLRISMNTTTTPFAFQMIYDRTVIDIDTGILYAAVIITGFYGLLMWELFDRTFVAVICSIASISILAALGDRPTMDEIITWIDMETMTLLFSMMILIAILTETGLFDYLAVLIFEISGGKIWPLIYCIWIFTCLVSTLLDNVTTVLLMVPVAIRLCEVMELDPVPVLMGIIVHSNIGGALTPIGDPISIIISTNHYIVQHGMTFFQFVEHSAPGVFLAVVQSCVYMRLIYWDIHTLRLSEPKAIKELKREIKVWDRAAHSLSSYSKDVDLVRTTILKKVKILKHKLKKLETGVGSNDVYKQTLEELKAAYPIKNKSLLIKSVATLVFVIVMFCVQSMPHLQTLPLSWVALLGVIFLLIIGNRDDMDAMMTRIEWTTLLFFASMFVTMECIERLGLIAWIGAQTENIILFVHKDYRLAMAIFIILWISALTSSVLDSIPVAAMMVKVVISLVEKPSLGLPLQPLIWALSFGACLGGNGTLYGASANILSAGIAEQHGYKISFTHYLKIVFPMMIGQIIVITGYLMVSHILFQWH